MSENIAHLEIRAFITFSAQRLPESFSKRIERLCRRSYQVQTVDGTLPSFAREKKWNYGPPTVFEVFALAKLKHDIVRHYRPAHKSERNIH